MPITEDEVAEAVRRWYAAFHNRDLKALLAFEGAARGFGYRPLARRDPVDMGEDAIVESFKRFYDQMVYFRLELKDLKTSVTGDIGLAWGTYVEEFQEKGLPPERARVRFSGVLTKREGGWQVLLYHRDIQPFNPDGTYPRALTMLAPTGTEIEL